MGPCLATASRPRWRCCWTRRAGRPRSDRNLRASTWARLLGSSTSWAAVCSARLRRVRWSTVASVRCCVMAGARCVPRRRGFAGPRPVRCPSCRLRRWRDRGPARRGRRPSGRGRRVRLGGRRAGLRAERDTEPLVPGRARAPGEAREAGFHRTTYAQPKCLMTASMPLCSWSCSASVSGAWPQYAPMNASRTGWLVGPQS